VPGDGTINQRRLDRLQERLLEHLEQPPAPGREEEVALMEEIILRVCRERDVAPERLALAALRLAQGDQPLLVAPTSFHVAERSPREGHGRSEGPGRSEAPVPLPAGMVRYRVEIGWRHRVKPGQLVGAIAGDTGLEGRRIGRITILADHSTVDLPEGLSERQLDGLQRCRVMQRELRPRRLEVG
jgi:ATP-dependent RNA helicase DeaD